MQTGSRSVLRWVGLLLFVASAQAQVQVQVQFPLGSNLSPYLSEWERNEALIRLLVINPTPEPLEGLTLGGQLSRDGGRVVARIREQHPSLPRFDLPAGGTVSLSWREAVALDAIDYDETEAERVATSGALPEGGYELCLWVVSADGRRLGETTPCPRFAVVLPDPPVLLEPVEGAVVNVNQQLPVFRWTPATPQFSGSAYRLVIKPRFQGQTPEQAMSENPVLFTTEVAATSYPYLPTDPDLLSYPDAVDLVWRVQHVVDGQPMGRNDGWSTIGNFRPVGDGEPQDTARVQLAGMLHFRMNLMDLYQGTLQLRGSLPSETPSPQEVKGERAVIYEVKMVPGSGGRPQIQIQPKTTGKELILIPIGETIEIKAAGPGEPLTSKPHLILFEFRVPDTLSREDLSTILNWASSPGGSWEFDFGRQAGDTTSGANVLRLQARSISRTRCCETLLIFDFDTGLPANLRSLGKGNTLLEIDFDATGRLATKGNTLLEIDFDATGRQGGDPPDGSFPCPGLPIPPGSPGPTDPSDCFVGLPYRMDATGGLIRDAGLSDLFDPGKPSEARQTGGEASSIFGIAEGEYNERKMLGRILPPEPPVADTGTPSGRMRDRSGRPVLSLLVFGDAGAGTAASPQEVRDNLGKGKGVRTIGFAVEGTFQPSRIWLPFPTTIQLHLQPQPESRAGDEASSIFGIAEGEYNERKMLGRLAPPSSPPTADPGKPSEARQTGGEASSIFGIAEGEYNERKMLGRMAAPEPPVWGFVSGDALYLAVIVQE